MNNGYLERFYISEGCPKIASSECTAEDFILEDVASLAEDDRTNARILELAIPSLSPGLYYIIISALPFNTGLLPTSVIPSFTLYSYIGASPGIYEILLTLKDNCSSNCGSKGKCFNGNCLCYGPLSGADCSQNTAQLLGSSFNGFVNGSSTFYLSVTYPAQYFSNVNSLLIYVFI